MVAAHLAEAARGADPEAAAVSLMLAFAMEGILCRNPFVPKIGLRTTAAPV
jgi:hypothetical protein